jgi:hypothetical protein
VRAQDRNESGGQTNTTGIYELEYSFYWTKWWGPFSVDSFDQVQPPNNEDPVRLVYDVNNSVHAKSDSFFYWVTNYIDSLHQSVDSFFTTMWFPDGQHTVKVIARDIKGNEIEDTIQVIINNPPRIHEVSPKNGAENLLRDSPISVIFKEDMDQTISLYSAIPISPSVSGTWEWAHSSKAVFTPDSLLERNTTYTVTATTALKDLSGKTLDGNGNGIEDSSSTDNYSWSFKTCPIEEGNDLFGYTADCDPYSWSDLKGTADSVELGDDNYIDLPIGFSFPFYDTSYTTARISSNGYLTFPDEDASTYRQRCIPSTQNPNNYIAPFLSNQWGIGGTNRHIYYKTQGNSFIVQYNNWGYFMNSGNAKNTYQVILENTGDIIFRYKRIKDSMYRRSIVGIEDIGGFTGVPVTCMERDPYVPTTGRAVKFTGGSPPCPDTTGTGVGRLDTLIATIPPCGESYSGVDSTYIVCEATGETLMTLAHFHHSIPPCNGPQPLGQGQFPPSGFDVLLNTTSQIVLEIGDSGIEDTVNLTGDAIIWRDDPDSSTRIIQTEMIYMDMFGVTSSAIPVWVLAGQDFSLGLPPSLGEIWPQNPVVGDFPAHSYFDVHFKFFLQERIVEPIEIDIQPMTCPNTLPDSGVFTLPVAILGQIDPDVYTINPSSILLEGVIPIPTGYNLVDTASPRLDTTNVCNCPVEWPDGLIDYFVEFDGEEILNALEEKYGSPLNIGDTLVLTLTGNHVDGKPFEGSDCVIVVDSLGGPMGDDINPRIPMVFALAQGVPNPFTGKTLIRYQLPRTVHVSLKVYDIAGRLVKTLVNEDKKAGYFRTQWDGKDNSGGL